MDISSRPLKHNVAVEEFFNISLKYDYEADSGIKDRDQLIPDIINAEMGVAAIGNDNIQTLFSEKMRKSGARNESERWKLREQIVEELRTMKRLNKDDDINLGNGGALPNSGVKFESKAFIVIGLPASGKSGIANDVSEQYGAIILDSDYAKRKLPEFENYTYGASLVHDESKEIIFDFTGRNPNKIASLLERCVYEQINIVIPIVGNDPERVINIAQQLKDDAGYTIHLLLVSLPKRESTIRAIVRFSQTGRYVPLGVIFDILGNDSSHCYYYLRCKYSTLFESFGAVSTINRDRYCVDYEGNTPARIYPEDNVILRLP